MRTFLSRYLDSLVRTPPASASIPGRPREGYSFAERYWASLTRTKLPPGPGPAARRASAPAIVSAPGTTAVLERARPDQSFESAATASYLRETKPRARKPPRPVSPAPMYLRPQSPRPKPPARKPPARKHYASVPAAVFASGLAAIIAVGSFVFVLYHPLIPQSPPASPSTSPAGTFAPSLRE